MAAPAFSCLQNMHRLKQRLALESFRLLERRMEIRKHGEESHMFRFFQPRVYVVAATLLCATVGAGGVWAVHWAHGVERLKLESCQRLLTALELERPIQVRGLVLNGS